MGFASFYLEERTLFPELIKEAPSEDTGIIVVIPSYDEPAITDLLDSLSKCSYPSCAVEVIIIVNAPAGASRDSLENNQLSVQNVLNWKAAHNDCFFMVYLIDVSSAGLNGWGVGMARKTGMDEALRRFSFLNKPDGIILNLDADCKVKENYFTAVFDEFSHFKERKACSIYFEHPVSGTEFPQSVYKAIIQYEMHLRYYFQAVAFTGFPYVHHTVGSAIAVKALSYLKSGGMNRRQAGEDFYFIQKLVPSGGFFNLNSTTVYPSPRSSARVPFGTGPVVSRISDTDNSVYLTYNFQAFRDLKVMFRHLDNMFSSEQSYHELIYSQLPEGLRGFVSREEWMEKIAEFIANTSNPESFRKRFFGWFNMFKIVKYLNSVHTSFLSKRPVMECASELLVSLGMDFKSNDPAGMLAFFRFLEKGC